MTTTLHTGLAPAKGLIVVSCSREKLVTTTPVPAAELYQGALVPRLRGLAPEYRARVRILSAAYGLLRPDDLVGTYDSKLRTLGAAVALRSRVAPHLDLDLRTVRHVLVALEPLYQSAVSCLFDRMPECITLLPDPLDWSGTSAVLSEWGWL
ncbi:hypothetical protein GCM10022243_32280 [Saccharothrix violaceirubra]|uniref:DUF6884 domain-containing protein n=1 Tax=Saccharothrix violaceirubra TaxID=413306 RepID=A0A7W7T5U0_9PSEU|nr:DUF6884 domain-containing protein [Saccharothrix violaceirubra]MBB4966851.1 hypothetical protein [Saccharothrix violaceirubra]